MCSGHQHFCGQAGQGGTADEKFPQALDRQGSSSTVCRSRQAQQMPPAASHVPGLGRSPWPRLRPGVLTRLNIRARSGPPACSRGCRITPQAPSSADAPGVRSPAGRPARQTAARSAHTAGGSSRWSSRVMPAMNCRRCQWKFSLRVTDQSRYRSGSEPDPPGFATAFECERSDV